jgi:hypothetical protein
LPLGAIGVDDGSESDISMKPLLPENPWAGSGVPAGTRERLLYNGPSQSLVVVMQREFGNTGPPVRRLYYRRLPGSTYEPISLRHEHESHEYAHSCEAAPYLIFNEMRFEDRPPSPEYLKGIVKKKWLPPRGWGADWIGIRRVNLVTGEDKRLIEAETLNVPSPYVRGWVAEILNVASDGSLAVCKVGLDIGGRLDYSVFEVSLTEGLRRKLADLPHTFL